MWKTKLYEKYREEFSRHENFPVLSKEEFDRRFLSRLDKMQSVVIDEPGAGGILFYDLLDEEDVQICTVPVFGYYASSEKVLTKLFIRLSEAVVKSKPTRFEIHQYARDEECIRALLWMEFHFMAESSVIRGEKPLPSASLYPIRTLEKEEISALWTEIWGMTSAIVSHLRASPVFYPGEEFTEKVYKEFFLDENTHLHVAFDEAGAPVGMIETNGEENALLAAPSANVGEVYVLPSLRGSGLSDALLSFAKRFEAERGNGFLWVEHGTANPNARGFWGRSFETFEYELDRLI